MGSLIGSTFRDTLAAQTNGVDEYMYVDNPTFKTDTQGCFAFRIYTPTIFTSGNGVLPWISYGVKTAGNNSRWFVAKRRDGAGGGTDTYFEQSYRKTHNGAIGSIQSTTTVPTSTWVTLVHQSDGSAYSIYLNGVAETLRIIAGSNTGDWLGDISGSDHRLAFGCFFNANAASLFCDCTENEAIYVNRPMTSGEITQWHNGGVAYNPHRITSLGSDLKSWWRFGDSRDDATTVYDEIGSNDLTLVNMDASNYVTP